MDDPQGKLRATVHRSRTAVVSLVFFVGLCVGFMAAQKMYLSQHATGSVKSAVEHRRAGREQVLQGASSELGKILAKVAPSGEVMIAISNMNLIRAGTLPIWLDVSRLLQWAGCLLCLGFGVVAGGLLGGAWWVGGWGDLHTWLTLTGAGDACRHSPSHHLAGM